MKLLVLGHSFIKRLHHFINDNSSCADTPFRLTEFQHGEVKWEYKGGMYVSELWDKARRRPTKALREIMAWCPEFIFIEIGTNDTTKVTYGEAAALGSDIARLLLWLAMQPKVKGVAWGAILPRRIDIREGVSPQARYNYGFDVDMFEQCRLQVNHNVRHMATTPVKVYEHERFETRKGAGLAEDGVHIKPSSMKHYWWSVRGALLQMMQAASYE